MKSFNQRMNLFEQIIGEVKTLDFPSKQGATSEVVIVQASNGDFVCKTATNSLYRTWLAKEADNLKVLSKYSAIQTPEIYQYVETDSESHLLMSLEKGVPLREALKSSRSEAERAALLTSFGQLLKELHEVELVSEMKREQPWLERQLEIAAYNLANYPVDGDEVLLQKLKENLPNPIEQTMIHGDCTIDNVLVTEGQVHMFIDVGGMAVGDPRYDVALAIRSIKQNLDDLQAFYRGYGRKPISEEEYIYFEGLYEFF